MLDYHRHDTQDGAAFLIGTDSEAFAKRLEKAATNETPQPSSDGTSSSREQHGGPIERYTSKTSRLGIGGLEHVGLNGHEIADAIQTRVNELFRNEFPVFTPRFERKCSHCSLEYSERVGECSECGRETREPDPAEKHQFKQLLESINKEGQSLRDLARACEWDQWLTGVPIIVLRHQYRLGRPGSRYEGEVIERSVEELVKGDPKRIVPVVDENRRIGGHWWACPRCRHHGDYDPADAPGRCGADGCHARLREVFFAERGTQGDVKKYYYREEILTFPWAFPRFHGLDGLSPVHHIWLKQLIIDFQDSYAAAFYDPESDRLPNQFIVLHTTNPDRWEARLKEARENSKDDVYDSPVFANEYAPSDSSSPEVQVVDAMPNELLGQNGELKDTFKKDIRQAINIADVFDSDLQEAGGLNNEGLQIEITDRSIASEMHDYISGWLDTLGKRLGMEDWTIGFIPSTGPDAVELREEVEAGLLAERAGLDARLEDGQTDVADGEFDPVTAAGGLGGFESGSAGGGGRQSASGTIADGVRHDYGSTAEKAATPDMDAAGVLFDAHRHMVWPDVVDQKAREPFWSEDEDMPEFVRELVREALKRGAISAVSKHLPPSVTRLDVREFFREKLDQPQGWSLRSLTEDYAGRFDVSESEAANAVRRQSKAILDKSREIGYEEQGGLDGRVFKWIGPIDDEKTDASWEVLAESNPDHGGTPRPLEELKGIVQEARRRHYPELTGAEWADSWQDRDTFVEHFG